MNYRYTTEEIGQLNAEIDRLRSENDGLHLDYQRICRGHDQLHDERDDARAEIARLQEQLSHGMPAIEELTKEREMYRMRWLGSMSVEDAALIRAENERLRAALTEIARTPARADVTGETMFTHVRLLAQKALDFTLEQPLERKP